MEIAHFLFGISGNATALFLFLAPTITFRRIIRSKSTELFSGIPYVMTMLNCLLSAWCGSSRLFNYLFSLRIVLFYASYNSILVWDAFCVKNNILVSTINGTGAAIEVIYVLTFIIYAPKKEKAKFIGLLTLVLTTFAGVALVSLVVLQGKSREILCGFAAAIFSIIMYGSPLSIMRTVIKTKSVEYMPFFLSLFVFLCGTSWFVFGLLGGDLFVSVPNGVGGGLGALQLILYFIYRNNKGEAKKPGAALPVHSMQMGIAKLHQQKELAANESHVDKTTSLSLSVHFQMDATRYGPGNCFNYSGGHIPPRHEASLVPQISPDVLAMVVGGRLGSGRLARKRDPGCSKLESPLRKSILDWYDQSRVLSPEKSEKKRKDDDEERGEMDVQ
ncbi:nodulin MtN3 family protein [Populus alba x Populus x berolinensis]|nr:nodulin MtN3 family protein [Populus alba x Populus x berolinensis]